MQGGTIRQEHGQSNRGSAAAARSSQPLHPLQAKLREHIDREDYKIKTMTESILYTFVPSAMKALVAAEAGTEVQEDSLDGFSILLTASQATAVAAAALAIATLFNAPPSFLEFLLCLPWSQFTNIYAALGDIPHSAPRLHLTTPTEDEKFQFVNCQLQDERLLDCIMNFLYIHISSNDMSPVLPPLMCLPHNEYIFQNGAEAGKLQKAIYVQLQGCTPLHCAAMRGNPALVYVLLAAGADPLVKNSLGQVSMELVPRCFGSNTPSTSMPSPSSQPSLPVQQSSQPRSSSCICRCMNQNSRQEEDPPECFSGTARLKLVRKSLMTCTLSLWAWVHMLLLCVLCVFGFLGCPTTLLRPEVESRGEKCWEERKKKAQHKAQATMLKLRTEALQGRKDLCYACGKSEGKQSSLGKRPLDDDDMYTYFQHTQNGIETTISEKDYLEQSIKDGIHPHLDNSNNNNNNTSCSKGNNKDDGVAAASRAYSHFLAAVNILKTIRLQQTCTPSSSSSLPVPCSSLIPEAHFLPRASWMEVEINEFEIAAVWGNFAESAMAMMEACGCAGCEATAGSAIHTAVEELMQLSGVGGGSGAVPSSAAEGGQGVTSPGGKKKNARSNTTSSGSSSKGSMKLPVSSLPTAPQQQQQQQQHSSDFSDLETRRRIISRFLATAVHAKAKFILKTDVQCSPTRAAIWRAQQCVTEWSRIARFGVASCTSTYFFSAGGGGGGDDGDDGCTSTSTNLSTKNNENDDDDEIPLEIQCLDSWATSAAADVLLVEALLGSPLPVTQFLSEALPVALHYDISTGKPRLGRTVTKRQLVQLENALKHAKKEHASEHIIALTEGVVQIAGEEIAAGERLRELLQQRSSSTSSTSRTTALGTGPSAEQLAAAIDAASRFPSLKEEVAQVEAMRERWAQRAAAQQQLDIALELARGPAPPDTLLHLNTTAAISSTNTSSTNASLSLNEEEFWKELNSRVQLVEAAIEAARQSSISVARAKKTLADLQAQGSAVEAGKTLEEALNGRAGSAALKAALSKAENAATAAAAGAGGAFTIGSEWLGPRLTAARTKLSLERAAETLARAVASCRTVSDLPKLEASILAAKKVGAHELDSAAYAAGKELRNRLDAAAKAKRTLENAVRALQKAQTRPEECILEAKKAISNSEQHGALLESEVAAAREAIQAAHAISAAEMKLTKALREGAGVAALSLAIKEAAVAGVQQVHEARKLLKLMQSLEAAVAAATTEGGSAARQSLQAKISASAAGGVPSSMISEARHALHKLLITDVRAELDAALKLTTATAKAGDFRQAPAQRLATLRGVLEKVDSILALEEKENESHSSRAAVPARSTSDASTDGGGGHSSGGAGTPPLMHEPEPTVFGGRLHTQESNVSQAASSTSSASTPRWSNSLSGCGDTSVGGDLSHLGSDCSAIELRILTMSDLIAVWFEPKVTTSKILNQGEVESGDGGSCKLVSSSSSDIAHHHGESSLATYDDAIAVRRMAQQARQRLHQEELEQARFEREKSEEARLYRELQLREKSAREAVEKERAEKARAERAERLAAVEAQKVERRERERAARAVKELERQAREAAAKEHFVLLQRRRKMLADQARAAHMAQLLAEQQAQQTAGLFSPHTSPAAHLVAAAVLPDQRIAPQALGSEAVSISGVMQLLVDQGNGAIEQNHQQQEGAPSPSPSQLPLAPSPYVFAPPPLATETSLPGSSSHIPLWTDASNHENALLSTKINGTALPPGGQNTTSLFGDLGGASWLATNPLTSGLPLETALTPPHTNSANNDTTSTTPNRTIHQENRFPTSPLALMWRSCEDSTRGALASTLATDHHRHHHHRRDYNLQHHRSLGSSGYDVASGLWNSIGSDEATTTTTTANGGGGGGGGYMVDNDINTSVLGLYPVQTTSTSHITDEIALEQGEKSATSSPVQHTVATATATAAHFRLPSETSLFE